MHGQPHIKNVPHYCSFMTIILLMQLLTDYQCCLTKSMNMWKWLFELNTRMKYNHVFWLNSALTVAGSWNTLYSPFVSLLTHEAHRKTDNVYGRILFSELQYSGAFFSSKVFQSIFGPRPPWCQGFKIVDILQGGDVNPMPNPKLGGTCPVSRSKPVQHEHPYQHVQWSPVEINLHFGGSNLLNFFHHKAAGSWFLQLAGKLLLDYVASYPRRLHSSKQPLWEPQISECSQHM